MSRLRGRQRSFYAKRALLLAIALAAAPLAAQAGGVVAQFQEDFTLTGPPAPGWSYLWNALGPVGDPTNYVPLVRDVSGNFETVANGAYPDPAPGSYLAVTPTSLIPGQSKSQAGGSFDRDVIVGYTLNAADIARYGNVGTMFPYRFYIPGESVDGIYSILYRNSTILIASTLPPDFDYNSSAPDAYPVTLGKLAPGDTIYTVITPRFTDTGDRIDTDYTISLSGTFPRMQVITGSEYAGAAIEQNADGAGIDVGSRDTVVFYEPGQPADYEQYRQWILQGQQGSGGIFTSAPMVPGTDYPAVIAPVDNHLVHLTDFGGVPITGDDYFEQLLLKYTYLGDVNLDGVVDQRDYVSIIANMGKPGTYFEGDANLDGVINIDDYNLVTSHLGEGVGGNGPQLASVSIAVPEPGALALLGMAGLLLRRRVRSI